MVQLSDAELAAPVDSPFGGFESRSVSALAAPSFAAAAVGHRVLASIPVGRSRTLFVARAPVEPGSAADGSTVAIEEAAAERTESNGCLVLALVTGEDVRWTPAPSDGITAGVELVLVATRGGLAAAVLRGVARAPQPAAAEAEGGSRRE